MEWIRLSPETARTVSEFNSRGTEWNLLPGTASAARIGVMRYSPGAVLGTHPAGMDQLFIVVSGSGWIRTGEGAPEPIAESEAVLWKAGEVHESGSESGMTALIVQAEAFDRP